MDLNPTIESKWSRSLAFISAPICGVLFFLFSFLYQLILESQTVVNHWNIRYSWQKNWPFLIKRSELRYLRNHIWMSPWTEIPKPAAEISQNLLQSVVRCRKVWTAIFSLHTRLSSQKNKPINQTSCCMTNLLKFKKTLNFINYTNSVAEEQT